MKGARVVAYVPAIGIKLFWCVEDCGVVVHQMRLCRHYRAFGEVVAFDCAAARGDEAGLVGFDCFDAVRGKRLALAVVLNEREGKLGVKGRSCEGLSVERSEMEKKQVGRCLWILNHPTMLEILDWILLSETRWRLTLATLPV